MLYDFASKRESSLNQNSFSHTFMKSFFICKIKRFEKIVTKVKSNRIEFFTKNQNPYLHVANTKVRF